MNKKIVLAVVLVLCLIGTTACGKSSGASGTVNGNGIKAMLTLSDGSDTFRATLAEAAQKAAKEAGVTLEIKDAAGSSEAQMNHIKDAQDADVIICALCDSGTAQQMEIGRAHV